jgi:malonyl-CoA decarboxylase
MAGDLAPILPVTTTSRFHYRIDDPDRSAAPCEDCVRSAAVRDALQGCHELLSERGERPENGFAQNILALYVSFDEVARTAFFNGLIERLSVDPASLQRAAENYLRNPSDETQQALQKAGEAPRRELFLRLNGVPGGTASLVRMREHLHSHLRNHHAWAEIDNDLAHVLRLLFNRGVLDLQQIDLETPFPVLERLIEAEAVHAINDWREMARRLETDRRCYAFFHPAWPGEPLIFTEVALTRGIAPTIQPILDPDSPVVDPRTCDTAMFYSISNCQPGLRGFSFGNPLISGVVERLRAEMPWLRRFATISPIPGFRAWLSASAPLRNASTGVGAWLSDTRSQGVPDELQDELLALCAHYLLRVKQGREPADAVARFHLGNGARLHRLNSASDLSLAGIRRSAGFTVNYVYNLKELARNAETYERSHEVCARAEVARLARLAEPLLSNPPMATDLPAA